MVDEELVKLRKEFLIKVGIGILVVIIFSLMVLLVAGPRRTNSIQKK